MYTERAGRRRSKSSIRQNPSCPIVPPMSQTTQAQSNLISPSTPLPGARPRPRALGKFFYLGDQKLYLRGVTYGTFRPDSSGNEYGQPEQAEQDFRMMAQSGINAVRLYTVPTRWLLDLAGRHGLYVMVGIPWEQHIAFLEGRGVRARIEKRVRDGVRACAGHPALLCYSIGNEIPASMVRWYGHRRVERFLRRLYRAAKQEDPEGLVTYVNYPTTEYLELPFLDFVSFNVYLESRDRLESYLARLQNLAGDRPLVMSEIGLDSLHHGIAEQAETLAWQIESTFAEGCAGAFVFAWTDEWHRGGHDVDGWDFGLTDRHHKPKPALEAVTQAFARVPFPADIADRHWPNISVVVCSHNGARTMRDCCEGLIELDYPLYEVIVVDDGSTDATADIASEYGFRVIRTRNMGLSSARNTGLEAAAGEIVAYTDDDARPDPHWLRYLAATFLSTDYVGVGGPNLSPSRSNATALCVANSPGGPNHVLLNDREAEHIPGCNMAFRKSALLAVGGFDPRFRTAGDDVDICWSLQERGWRIGFSPAALVWHHRRGSVRAYWRQQTGYGRAEALLEKKWPHKYNAAGHIVWAGKLYGDGLAQILGRSRQRIYSGTWGSAPFQSVYGSPAGIAALLAMPEWYALIGLLTLLAALGLAWTPLLFVLPLLVSAIAAPLAQAALGAARASFPTGSNRRLHSIPLRALTFLLHFIQPLARLAGRFAHGLTPWRRPGRVRPKVRMPWPSNMSVWREDWQAPQGWLEEVEEKIRANGGVVKRGGDFDRWDLEARGGILGSARLLMGIEEHAGGRQLARFRAWPVLKRSGLWAFLLFASLAVGATLNKAPLAAFALWGVALLLAGRTFYECGVGLGTLRQAVLQSSGVYLSRSGKPARRGTYLLLLSYALPLWRGWLLILVLTVLSTAFTLLQPWPMKVLVDNVLGAQPLGGIPGSFAAYLPGAQSQGGLLLWVMLGGLLVFLGTTLLDSLLTYNWVRIGHGMVYRLASDLFARIQRRSLLFHSRNAVGDSLSRITTDAWSVYTIADTVIFAPAHALVTTVTIMAVMLPMNLPLTMLSLLVAPFMLASALLLGWRVKAASRRRRRIESRIQAHVQRTLSGISVVQAFTREEHEHRRFREFIERSIRAQQRSAFASNLYNLGAGLISALGAALVLWTGAHEVLAGRLSVGGLLVFVSYLGVLQSQFRTLAATYRTVQETAGSAERVAEVLNSVEEIKSKPGAAPLPRITGSVSLCNISFGYEPDRPVLHDLSLEIATGQTVAIMGATGAGKSTLAGLIARLYDPWRGSVKIDGHDIRDVGLESLRRGIALVLQEPFLFPFSILENIRYGRPGATDAEIRAAAEAAGAHSFIEQLLEGYHTLLGERGATLSGGERQRLSIARALLKNAPVLILDEPTSALDSQTEQKLVAAIKEFRTCRSAPERMTTIIISHRLSTVCEADRILVLQGGKLVEEGTHLELMGLGGRYADLHRMQSGTDSVKEDAAR